MAGFGDELLILRGPTGLTDQSTAGVVMTQSGSISVVADTGASGVSAFSVTSGAYLRNVAFASWKSCGCWVRRTDTASAGLFESYNTAAPQGFFAFVGATGGRFDGKATGVSTYRSSGSGGTTNDDAWHLVVCQVNGTTLEVWVDGVLVSSSGPWGGTFSSRSHLNMFGVSTGDVAPDILPFVGKADDLRVFSTIRTSGQIAAWYAAGRGYDYTAPDMSVLGTAPVAAWCPSLDTAGNGTTTLTDLSGNGNNGTLINLVPATDWTTDDGKRAIRSDGVDGYVSLPQVYSSPANLTISAWIRKTGSTRAYLTSGTTTGFELYETIAYANANGAYTSLSWNSTGWHHWMLAFDGTATGNSNRWKLYIDGILQAPSYSNTVPATLSLSGAWAVGRRQWSFDYKEAWWDDIRFFDVTLNATDAAYLATGRGVQPAVVSAHPFHPLQRGSTHPLRYT